MDEVLQIKKGSSGYSAPGPNGLVGDSGKSSHFSSIPIDSSLNTQAEKNLISTRITKNQSLTNNEKCIEEEYYEVGDIIIDMYADLGILTSKSPVTIEKYGNIIFNGINSNIYKAPIDSSSGKVADLTFIYVDRQLCSLDGYMLHKESYDSSANWNSPMFHHRWQNRKENTAPATIIEASDDASTDVIDYNGTTMSSKDFIEKILKEEIYCKLVVLFKNGLSYELPKGQISRFYNETQNISLNIFDGYFDLIGTPFFDSSWFYQSFDDEINPISYQSFDDETNPVTLLKEEKYKGFLIGSVSTPKLCDIYFEYAHEGKIYRMNVNVKEQ